MYLEFWNARGKKKQHLKRTEIKLSSIKSSTITKTKKKNFKRQKLIKLLNFTVIFCH